MTAASVLPVLPVGPVPRTLHFVWVGSDTPPWVRLRWDYWLGSTEQDGLRYGFWTDEKVDELLPFSAALRPLCRHRHPVLFSDIVRIEAVARYGGVYLDSDIWPLRSIEPLLDRERGWASLNRSRSAAGVEMNNAVFGFSAGHPFLSRLWSIAVNRLGNDYRRLQHFAGPPVWTRLWRSNPLLVEGIAPEMIYPVPWWRAGEIRYWSVKQVAEAFPDALLWHEFAQTWQPSHKGVG